MCVPTQTYLLALLACLCCLAQSNTPIYSRTDDVTGESLACDMCPPGTHLVKHCAQSRRTECAPCPSSHYTEIWNYIEKCLYCNVYCTENQFEKVQCTNVTNRVCGCKDGFHMKHGSCYQHTQCPPGEGVIEHGTAEKDVKCETCEYDLFSSHYSSTDSCQEYSLCPAGHTTIPGNDKRDVFCSVCKNGTKTEDQEVCADQLKEFMKILVFSPKMDNVLKHKFRRIAKERKKNLSRSQLLEKIRKERNTAQNFAEAIRSVFESMELSHQGAKILKWFSF
ncbi:tumor necrosis factor receptor superfamily member 6B-like [Hypomesus transpacificus]|uniref:tumor necrosis factor receptor superfamily member 6B-like n=1 Tax=Hypomesus transpacificus TaxID=137520 RepID=UPI001F07E73A|nr:tumor necrosis factor receptor superfamily member 6B-like [Hypomesus transpacificus]